MELPLTIRLQGGLGNQLFQWAFGYARSREWSVDVRYDIGLIRTDPQRDFVLGLLRLPLALLLRDEEERLAQARFWKDQSPVRRLVKSFLGYRRGWPDYVREEDIGVPDHLRKPRRPTVWEGYWQGEEWFAPAADELRSLLLEARDRLTADEPEWREGMSQESSVAVHVRRGDYVANPGVTAFHGVLTPDHYEQAARRISDMVANPVIFLFSDDPDWCETHVVPLLQTHGSCQVVRLRDRCRKEVWELMLMASCRHHIIANSSFSWWGAWLAERPGQIVIAPKQWYAPGSGRTDSPVPERWLKL